MTSPLPAGQPRRGGEWEKRPRHSEDASSLWTRCSTVELTEISSVDFDFEDEEKETNEDEEGRRRNGRDKEGLTRPGENIASLKDVEEEEKLTRRILELVLVEYNSDGGVPVTESVLAAIGPWQGESQELVGNSSAWADRHCFDGFCQQRRLQGECAVVEGIEEKDNSETNKNGEPMDEKQDKVVVATNESFERLLSTGGIKSVISPECLEVNKSKLKHQQIKQHHQQCQQLQKIKQPVAISMQSFKLDKPSWTVHIRRSLHTRCRFRPGCRFCASRKEVQCAPLLDKRGMST
eukprot:GHVS01063974.1.p1 GENE.GHVS01063974.1~~GHVS01063974.1.p1  ORF type:complete len:293 (+),score=59.59 GHVS01063974.1:131-1009(+)